MFNCCHASAHEPLYCFLPPYVLERIARHGSPEQKAWAERTLAASKLLRFQREAVSKGKMAPGPAGRKGPAAATAGKQRSIYSADQGSNLPGRLLRQEGQPPNSDTAANEAYDGAGDTYDLFHDVYQRNSIDNLGMSLVSTIHYQRSFDNAFWNGSQMVYGDGDEDLPLEKRLFNRFTMAVDVIAHELTHGVTQNSANLVYSGQSGALNESISDVFGSLVKQRRLGQTARQADWIIGQGLITRNVRGVGIRSMKAPGTAYNDPVLGKDPQPAHMGDFVATTADYGGVHINSGIPNHAFYVAAYELDGFAWEKIGRVWYTALTGRLSPTATFQETANLTFALAGQLFGSGSLEQMAVRKGWVEVGIEVAPVPVPTPSPNPGCLAALVGILRPSGER